MRAAKEFIWFTHMGKAQVFMRASFLPWREFQAFILRTESMSESTDGLAERSTASMRTQAHSG
ncbi:hypothetical protein ARC02_10695 [Stenotrophomonas africana]|nr:hypothetical protein ARC02_10695 [Stenotrophomonas maltophilia]